jgi:hypothetical protein
MRHPNFAVLLTTCAFVPVLLPAAPGRGQEDPKSPPVTRGKAGTVGEQTFTLDLRDAPFHDTLRQVFASAKLECVIADDVPDGTITIQVTNVPFSQLLPLLLKEGGKNGKPLTYVIESKVYVIRARKINPPPSLPVETIPVVYRRADELVTILATRFPDVIFLPPTSENTILLRGEITSVTAVREAVRLLDVKPREFVIKAEVAMVAENGKKDKGSALLNTILRTTAGKEAESGDTISGTPAQTAKLTLRARVHPLGDGTFEVENVWELSLPLTIPATANKPAGLARLEKRSSGTVRLRAGDTTVAGGVLLRQYGLDGQVMLFLTVTPVPETSPAPPTQPTGKP